MTEPRLDHTRKETNADLMPFYQSRKETEKKARTLYKMKEYFCM